MVAGRRLGSALVAAYGQPPRTPGGGLTDLFPTAEVLADAALGEPGMPESRRRTLRTLTATTPYATHHFWRAAAGATAEAAAARRRTPA